MVECRLVRTKCSCPTKIAGPLQLGNFKHALIGEIAMQSLYTSTNESILEQVISLAHFGKNQRILIAGEKSIELMFDLASVANCGHRAKQYHVALVDWRRRTFRSLEAMLNWLVDFLCDEGLLIVLTDPQKARARANINAALEKRGFVVEKTVVEAGGYAVSARRRELKPVRNAA
jgi:hypothetical protein